MNQTEAYCAAYRTEKWARKTIWEAAARLAENSKVSARIGGLKDEIAKKNLWTREMSVKILGSIATKQGVFENNRIAAIKELNAMHGYNSPTKHEVTVNPLVLILETDEGAK